MAVVKKCLGVDLGSSAIKVVELSLDKKSIKVTKAAVGELGIELSATPEERRAAIIQTLKRTLKENKITTKQAVFSLPGQKVFIRRFRMPATSPERLERLVAYEARQQIPFDIDKTDLQWQSFDFPEDNEVEVLLVAIRHDEVRSIMSIINKTGLKSVAIAVSSFALFNAQTFLESPAATILERLTGPSKEKAPKKGKGLKLGLGKKKKGKEEEEEIDESAEDNALEQMENDGDDLYDEVFGFVNIGASAMDLTIATHNPKKSFLKFSRSVPEAGNNVTKAIMKSCDVSSFLDADRIKRHQSRLMTFDYEPGQDADLNDDACAAATQATDRMVSELRKSLDFFITQPDGMAVDTLVLSGGQSQMSGLQEYIEEKLTIPVKVNEKVPEDLPVQWPEGVSTTEFIVALGLGLQGVGMVNVSVDFLPEEKKITRDFPFKMVAVLVALLVVSIYFMSQAGQNYSRQYLERAGEANSVISRNTPLATQRAKAEQRRDEIAKRYEEFQKVVVDRDYWVDFLVDLSISKPADVVINRIELDHQGEIEIVGVSERQASAATFNSNLKNGLTNLAEGHDPRLMSSNPVPGDQFGFPDLPRVNLFVITLKLDDKLNRLEVFPTPTPGPNSQNNRQNNRQGNQPNNRQTGRPLF